MSVKEIPAFRVVCDWPGCGACAQDEGEYYCWTDPQQAVDDADDWETSADGKRHYCPYHPAAWASDHEQGEPFPDPPYLLIHDGDTDDPTDDGHVTLIWVPNE